MFPMKDLQNQQFSLLGELLKSRIQVYAQRTCTLNLLTAFLGALGFL